MFVEINRDCPKSKAVIIRQFLTEKMGMQAGRDFVDYGDLDDPNPYIASDSLPDQDKEIRCVDCGSTFEFTAGEQNYYRERELNFPKRCKTCAGVKRGKYKKKDEEGSGW